MADPKAARVMETISTWPESITSHLNKCGATFTPIAHNRTVTLVEAATESGVQIDNLVRSVLLKDGQGILMVIMPAARLLDFSALCSLLQRELHPVTADEIRAVFKDCEPGSYPPLPKVFKLQAIVDQAVYEMPKVFLEPGIHEVLLEMSQEDFQKALGNTMSGSFTEQLEYLSDKNNHADMSNVVQKFTPARMKDRTEETFELPSLPPIADEILRLRVDPDADSKKLATIIEKDPSLSAQLISWARSPFYGYAGKVESVDDAIIKVLGFDLVMNLALGIVVGKSMRVPVDGPLGLKAYWRLSLYTSCIIEKLLPKMPRELRPPRGLAYLSGLLHNFGHLILGEIFPPQFFILNRYISVNPHISISKIEQHVLGVKHEQIGAWLMQAWHMPPEVIAAVKWHHQGEFVDEYRVYSNLVYVAIRLLKQIDVGDATCDQIPNAILETLGLDHACAQAAFEEFLEHKDELLAMSNQLTS